jgi:3-isopropylmalate/(R)-2-methylmalate dehydratase small subunit
MQAFTRLTGVAVPIDLPNIDTDRVIPARFLRKPQGSAGYERYLFHDVRFDAHGAERPEFVLNQAPYRPATIVVAAENFGCGSSREAAVWALMAYGIRVVVAPSLGDIFHQNCLKNGLLPVILPADVVADLRRQLHARPGATIAADLETQTVTAPDGTAHPFQVEPFARQMLLTGQDEITLTLGHETQIREYETRHRAEMPWLMIHMGGPDMAPPAPRR